MSEVIFTSNDIEVTNTMAKFGDTSYPIANIGSVTLEEDPSSLLGVAVLLIVGAIIAFFTDAYGGMMWCIIGAVVLGFIGVKLSGKKLMLRTSSGNEQAFASANESLVIEIKNAIEEAVSKRG